MTRIAVIGRGANSTIAHAIPDGWKASFLDGSDEELDFRNIHHAQFALFCMSATAGFDVAFDPRGNTAESYQVKAMPSSYIIDKHGKVVHANLGFRGNDEEKLEEKIRNLIRQSTVASR